jgi:hypothetical protein
MENMSPYEFMMKFELADDKLSFLKRNNCLQYVNNFPAYGVILNDGTLKCFKEDGTCIPSSEVTSFVFDPDMSAELKRASLTSKCVIPEGCEELKWEYFNWIYFDTVVLSPKMKHIRKHGITFLHGTLSLVVTAPAVEVSSEAFYASSLSTIEFLKDVKLIHHDSFNRCKFLKKVIFHGKIYEMTHHCLEWTSASHVQVEFKLPEKEALPFIYNI